MLSAIVRFSLRFRGVIIALAIVAVAYGIYETLNAKYDVFPEFATPQISIQTEAAGLSPEQVEILVTQRIENSINGAPGVESIRSESIQGLSLIVVNFDTGSEIYRDRQDIGERLSELAGALPAGVSAPMMTPLTSSTGDLLTIGLLSDKLSPMQLRTLADWVIVPRLLAVPGVAKMSVYGGEVRQVQIQIDPQKLIARDLSIEDVRAAAAKASGVRGAGFIDTTNQRIVLRTQGESLSAAQIGAIVVAHQPQGNVTLGDVARVVDAPRPAISEASVMGRRGVVINAWAQYRANTLEATAGVEKALDQLAPVLKSEGVTVYPAVFRSASYIELATHNINAALILGAILVVVVLFLFLANFRAAAISCTAIPLSLLVAIVVLQRLGLSLNTLTLGGLAIAIGEVVDDAVIDVENIQRRLRENVNRRPVLDVVYEASLEVRGAVVYATFAVALVFMPILTMSGLAGRLFGPMGLAYIFSILASLLVALTVTPALGALLLRGDAGEHAWLDRLKAGYRAVLIRVEQHPGAVVGAVAFITIAGLAMYPLLGKTFLPALHENHYIVHMEAAPGTSLAESARIGTIVQRELMKLPFVRYVAQRAGRAESDDVYGPQSSEIEVDLRPLTSAEARTAAEDIRKTLDGIPGPAFAINTFLTERIEETLSGYTAPVVAQVVGNDLDLIDAKAQEVGRALSAVPGAADVQFKSPPGAPEVTVRLRPNDVARWGFDPVDVLESIRVAYSGENAGELFEGSRVFELMLILPPEQRNSIDIVGDLPLRSPSGTHVKVRDIADVFQSSGRYAILHEAARRVQTITCGVQGRDVASFVKDARKAVLEKVQFPAGTYVEFTGAAEAEAQSRRDLIMHSAIALVGIALLLAIVIGKARNLLLLALNLPFALVGGIVAALITNEPLSVGSMVGFVTLFGITLRNSIMMVSHYEHLVEVEGAAWSLDTVLRGATERLAPIVMTSLVTALGLLPLAIGRSAPGREIEGAMATVILGGLVTSTALNLLVLPTLAWRWGNFKSAEG